MHTLLKLYMHYARVSISVNGALELLPHQTGPWNKILWRWDFEEIYVVYIGVVWAKNSTFHILTHYSYKFFLKYHWTIFNWTLQKWSKLLQNLKSSSWVTPRTIKPTRVVSFMEQNICVLPSSSLWYFVEFPWSPAILEVVITQPFRHCNVVLTFLLKSLVQVWCS